MDTKTLEYIKGIKPEAHVNGMDLVREGIKIGNSFAAGRSRFVIESGGRYSCHMDYKKECMAEGKIVWDLLIGLATLEEECSAITELHRRATEIGYELPIFQCIASPLVGLPKEYRENAPSTTSYMLDGLSDYQKHWEAAPAEIIFGDHHLVTPNAIETTINALKIGSPRVGEFSQFIWDYSGFDDEVKRYSDMVTALGIMASKREEMFTVETYLDDGFPGYFMDCVSFVGYALMEHYICSRLCNARYSISFAGLLSENDTRLAIPLALHKLLSTEEQPVMSYINGSTNMQWDHDINGNFGFSSQEMLFEILAEKKFHMGLGINPVSITEKIAVPTMDELWDIFVAGKRVEEKADEWLPFMDFTKLEEMSDVLAEQGTIFFNNALEGLSEGGIDIEDPLELLLTLKHFDPIKFEQAFHPSTCNKEIGEIQPFYPTVLGRQTVQLKEDVIKELREGGHMENELDGKTVVIGSADAHTYGIIFAEGVLTAMGANVINGGVDMEAVDLLDLADEEGSPYIGVSCHNGQALDFGKQMLELAEKRGRKYGIWMGGKLNAILPGHSEPTEIGDMLMELGIEASNDIGKTLELIRDNRL